MKEYETYAACQVPSQFKLITNLFPYKEGKILLLEAVYKIMHDHRLIGMVKLLESSSRSFSSVIVANLSLLHVTGVPSACHVM